MAASPGSPRSPTPPAPHQGRLALIPGPGQPGDSSLPPEAADAACHGANTAIHGQRAVTAPAAANTAATASANTEPRGAGGSGSAGAASTNSTVNTARTASARAPNLRSQPRTVSGARPSEAAIARCPAPAAFATNATPINAATSARRSNTVTGSNTCETPQPGHRERRGRSTNLLPYTSRTTRRTAHPHGRSAVPHPGQSIPSADSRFSTRAGEASTVTTAPPCATAALPAPPPRRDGRAVPMPDHVHVVVAHDKGQPSGLPYLTSPQP